MIEAYLTDTVQVLATTLDEWGEPDVTTTREYLGRPEWGNRLVTDYAGNQVMSTARFMLPADAEINSGDRLVHNGTTYTVITKRKMSDWAVRGIEVAVL